MPTIRPYRPSDWDAITDICIRTGDSGQDATALYPDPELLADVYARPYVVAEPQLAFVLDDDGQAVGYILGTADTVAHAAWVRAEWLPRVAGRYPAEATKPQNRFDRLVKALHRPEWMIHPEAAGYPAHLHIDVLPRYQGQGWGRELMSAFLGGLRSAGVGTVHLAYSNDNTRAGLFYARLGFHVIEVAGVRHSTLLGRSTHPLAESTGRDSATTVSGTT